MMSFCKKSVHSFLALANHPMSVSIDGNYSSSSGGLGLITATTCETPNILESTTVKSSSPSTTPPPSPSPPSSIASLFKKDPGGIGFLDDIGGGVDGLMSCTESLGFESCDERRVDDEIELCSRERTTITKRKFGEKKEVKKFPPPLSSLNHNGQPNYFLKSVRKDGRLELTEVRIDRHEILRASRQDGRLRLHFVEDEESEVDEEESELEQEQEQEQEQEYLEEAKEGEKELEEEEEEVLEVEEKIEEENVGEWGIRVNGEGLRIRCHELVAHHHDYHHHSNVWSQQCVPTR